MKKILATLAVLCFGAGFCFGQGAALDVLQRRFVDLRFGATYADTIRLTVLSSRKTSAPDGVYESGSTVAISELGIYNERPR